MMNKFKIFFKTLYRSLVDFNYYSDISNNTVGADAANDIANGSATATGIRLTSQSSATVSFNTVRNLTITGASNAYGIYLESAQGTNNVFNNIVSNIITTSTSTSSIVYGIRFDVNSTHTINAYNNLIYGLNHGIATTTTTFVIRALALGVSGSGTGNINFNSVRIDENEFPTSAAFYLAGGTANVKNNIFANFSTAGATSKRYAIYRSWGTLVSDYNDLFIATGTNNFVGYYTADQATFADWQTASSQDANSLSVDPQFVSATDLHIAAPELDHAGVVIAGITTDIDGETRSTVTPDIGADEGDFETTPPTVTFNPADAATDVAVSSTVVLTFSEAVRNVDDADFSVANFTLTDAALNTVTCIFNYNPATFTVTLTPTTVLAGNTVYTVTALNVEDISNNALAAPVSASFTTGEADITAPTFVSAQVANLTPANVDITFNESVKYTDFTGFTVSVDGTPATINSIAGNMTTTITLTLSAPVTSHQVVTYTYTGGNVTDIATNPLADITDQAVVNNVISSEKDILTFNITTPAVIGVINGTNISLMFPTGTDVTALVTEITISDYAAVVPASGVTQDFTNPVTYTVTAEDGTTQIYTVTADVIQTIPYAQDFDALPFPPAYWALFNAGFGNNWTRTTTSGEYQSGFGGLKYGFHSSNDANAWAFTPTFTLNVGEKYVVKFYQKVASATYPEKLKVTVGLGKNVAAQTSTIWDNDGGTDLSNTTFILRKAFYDCTVTGNYNFAFNAYSDFDQFNLFVDAVVVAVASSAADITAFDFTTPAATGTITTTNIAITVPAGTDVTALVPTVTISLEATVSPLTGVAQDFTSPVQYTVTAEDGTTQIYTVTVTVTAPTVAILPANGTTGIATDVTPTLTFDAAVRNIDDSEITDANVDGLITFKTPDAAGANVAFDATISVDKKVITITPTAALSLGTNYYISIGATFEEINNLVVAPVNSTFTTTEIVDWCNLQWPLTTAFNSNSASENIYARVYAAGVTEAAGQGVGIQAWIGYNNADTDPSTWTNWIVATYNADNGNNDEYVAQLPSGLAEGTYYYASRFQMGIGVYSYGGLNDNFWNLTTNPSGIATVTDNIAPTLTTATVENAAPADVVLVFSEPVTLTNATGFTINVDGAPVAVNAAVGTGTNTITLTLASNVPHHAVVTLSYDATIGDVQDMSAAQNDFASVTDFAVTNNVMNTENDILTFNITTPAATGTITGTDISILLPAGTNVTALVPTITVSGYATVSPASGVAQDFTSPVIYTVTAEDGTTQDYIVGIYFTYNLPYSQNFENASVIPENWSSTSNDVDNWDFVSADAAHGAATSQSGTGYFARLDVYNVSTDNNPVNLITPAFNIPATGFYLVEYNAWIGDEGSATPLYLEISADNQDTWTVLKTHDNTSVTNTWFNNNTDISAYNGMTVFLRFRGISNYGYGTCNLAVDDFVVRETSSAKDILTFDFTTPAASGTITGTDIEILVPYGTVVTALTPTITISSLATIAPLSGVAQNFTNPVQYTVTAEDGTTKTYTVTVVFDDNTETDILTFDFNGLTPTVTGTVNATAHTVALTVPFGTDLTTLEPTITLSYGATVSPTSGTANDFTNPATYVVTAEDGTTTQDWTVTVTVAPNTANDILTFDFDGLTPAVVGTVNATAHTVTLTVPYGTDVTTLVPTITLSPQATVSPLSNVAADFTNPVTYTVTSGSSVDQDWTVTVSIAPNTANDILTFNFNGLSPAVVGTVDVNAHTVTLTVPYGSILTALVPTITVSPEATINPTSGTPNDFTNQVTYTVTSGSSAAQDWTVTVSVAQNTANNIIAFDIPTQVSSTINDLDHSVIVTMPAGTNLNGLIPTITIPYGANITPASGVAQDFTNAVQYTVTSESNAAQIWTVTVNVEASNGTDILTYTIPSQVGNTVINEANSTVTITVPFGTDVTNLIATYTVSTGATAAVGTTDQESGVTTNDFTNPVQYEVTAQDGNTSELWTVTVNVAQNTEANILTFDLNGLTPAVVGTVNSVAQTVTLTVPYGTNVTALIPTITVSAQATISPLTDVAQNFTSPVTYTVTAGNGTTLDWIVTVVIAPNTANDILTFNFNGLTPAVIGTVDANAYTVSLIVPFGTDVTALVSTITVSPQATVSPVSGNATDFTNPVTYTVTSGSSVDQDWTVTVTFAPNTAAEILTFDFNGLTPTVAGIVNGTAHTVTLTVPFGTDVTTLIPSITVSSQATVSPESGVAADFTSPVTYTVTAGSDATQDWIVTVNVSENTETDILTFNFEGISPVATGVVNATDHTVTISVTCNATLLNLVPSITLSEGATIAPVSGVSQNFTTPVTYTVTAEDGVTTQAWIVTATVINPEITSTTPATRCGEGTVTLNATANTGSDILWYDVSTGGTALDTGATFATPSISSTTTYYAEPVVLQTGAIIGTGTSTSTGYESPFYHLYGGKKSQYVILASELTAAGLTPGNINSIALNVVTAGTTYNDFNVNVGTTSATAMTSTFITGLTNVFSASAYTLTTGICKINLSAPFNWDGTSNLVIEYCWSNDNSGGTSATVKFNTTSYVSQAYFRADNQIPSVLCGATTATSTMSSRPQFYINYVPSCEGTREAVIATVTPAPVVTATVTPETICGGETVTLAASSTNTDYTFTWTPVTTPTSGASVTATPAATTVFTVTAEDLSGGANDGCVSIATVTVNVHPQPSEITVTPAAPSVCAGGIQELTITGGTIGGTGTIGTGTVSNTVSTPYKGYWGGIKAQYLYTVAELSAMGLTAGMPFKTIALSVSAFTSPYTYNGFTIGMKNTSSSVLTTTIETGVTEVLTPSNFVLTGTAPFVVTHVLTTPFAWDGVSNLLVETCFNNNNGGGTTTNSANVNSTTTSTYLCSYYSADNNANVCSAPGSATTTYTRPNITFDYDYPTTIAWTPVTDLFTDENATVAYTGTSETTVYSKPTDDRTYTITATSSESCTRTGTVTITVDPVSATLEPIDATCNGGSDGSFTLGTVTCGVAPFTYAVDGGAFGAIPTNLTAGTHSVVIKDADNNLSAPISITIGEPAWVVTAPTSDGDVTVCQNENSALLSVTPDEIALPQTMTISFDITDQPVETNEAPGNIVATANFAGLPVGSVVTNVTLNCNGITALGGSWQSEVRLGLSGSIANAEAAGTGALSSSGTFNYTRVIPNSAVNIAGGDVNLLYWDSSDDNTGAESTFPTGTNAATITIEYLPAQDITWYDAATGGNVLGTESTLEAVGTSVLANTTTPGTYNFYAEAGYNACTSSSRTLVSVIVNTLPTITTAAAPSASVCPGTSVTLTANGGTTYTWDNGVTDGVAFIPTATATYNVIGVDNNGCENTASIEVVVNTLPVVDLGADITVCDDVTVTLDAGSFASYLWNDNSTAQTLVATANGTYSVTVTDANGCTDADTINVVINPNPIAVVLSSTDPSVCGATDASISVTDDVTYTYAWNTTPAQTTATANNLGAGIYNVSVSLGACQIVLTESISDPGAPTITLATDDVDNILCEGTDLTFTAGGLTSGSYEIYVNNTLANTIPFTMTSVTEAVDQSFSVYLVGTDAGGCSGTSNIVNVVVNPLPVVSLGANIIACDDTDVVLDAQNAGATYVWSTTELTQTIVAATSDTYSVTVTDVNACVNADTITVTINPVPVVNLGSDVTVCAETTVTLDAGNAGATFDWNTTATSQTIEPVVSGTYSVVVMNSYNCTGADTVVVAINPLPVINLGADINTCVGTTVDLDAQNAGASYTWNTLEITQTIVAATSGIYSVTVTDANACVNADTIDVVINPVPVVNLGSDVTVCEGTTVTLDAGNVGASFLWNTTGTTQTIDPIASGTYSVVVTDANNCTGTDTVDVVINLLPVVDLGGNVGFCAGSSLDLDAENAGASFLWSTTVTTQSITVTTAGNYSVTVTDANNCSAIDTAVVSEYALPTATFEATSPSTICLGDSVEITATFTGTAPWTIVVTDGTTPETHVLPVSPISNYLTPAQTSTITLVSVTDNNSCTSTVNLDVDMTVLPIPVVDIGADSTLCSNFGETVTLDAGNAGATYLWSDNSTSQTLTVNSSGMTPGVYNYSVTVSNGACEVSDEVQITVDVCGGISSVNADMMKISMYPNPTKGMITISVDGADNFVLSIYDATGKEIINNSVFANETEFVKTLDLTTWPKGMYLVKVSSNNTIKTQTIVLQ